MVYKLVWKRHVSACAITRQWRIRHKSKAKKLRHRLASIIGYGCDVRARSRIIRRATGLRVKTFRSTRARDFFPRAGLRVLASTLPAHDARVLPPSGARRQKPALTCGI